jgi:UPF0176 protein
MMHITRFYHFAPFPEYAHHQQPLKNIAGKGGLKGTLLLTAEGVNATLSGEAKGIEAVLAYLRALRGFEELVARDVPTERVVFKRLKVLLKKETITLKTDTQVANPPESYIAPEAWDALLDDPEVVLIDTRNDYEVEAGTFSGALNPNIQHFSEFPQWVAKNLSPTQHKKVAMFCTGGIRCEKAASYMQSQGFEKVYQLHGGILTYLEQTQNNAGKWQGNCFVFDERRAV